MDRVNRPGGVSVSTNEQLPKIIRELDLGCIRHKMLSPDSPVKWTTEQARVAEEEYRKFLTLHYLYPHLVVVPDGAVDVFWHQHILDTEKYADDCQKVFGRFIHHFPYLGLRGKEDATELLRSFDSTLNLYDKTFGEPPHGHWHVASDCGCTGCSVGNCSPNPRL